MRGRLLVAALMLAACDKSTAPTPAVPALGAYAYASGGAGGTLTLTVASGDLLQGAWAVSTFRGQFPAPFTAVRQGDAWVSVEVVNAAPPQAPFVVAHRWTMERGALVCTANGQGCTVTRTP